jgi:hypothetical protein
MEPEKIETIEGLKTGFKQIADLILVFLVLKNN